MNMCLNPHCPGWMVVPRKPTPFGNEYHSICDGVMSNNEKERGEGESNHVARRASGGKDRPTELGQKEFNDAGGKTVGLMMRMHKSIARQGKACTMDSGFCVSVGIVRLFERLGVYAQSLIKKRGRFWPKSVPGDQIDEHFRDKPIGYRETLKVEVVGQDMYIHCMKEEKYVTKFMSTFGTLDEVKDKKARRTPAEGPVIEFYYPEPMSWHNSAKHWVDDHNQRRQAPIDIADIWKTQWWPHRQFSFFISISETNAANSRARGRGEQAEPQLTFRKSLAMCMLENTLDDNGNIVRTEGRSLRSGLSVTDEHKLETRPVFTGRWLGTHWHKTKAKYNKWRPVWSPSPRSHFSSSIWSHDKTGIPLERARRVEY